MLQRHLGPCISVAPVSCPFIFLTCFVPKPTRKSNHIMTWSLHQKPLGHVPKSFRLLECNQRDVWCPSADLDFVKPRLRTAITWKIEVIFITHGLNHWRPPFTCLDEDIKNMEVWSLLSECSEHTLLNIDVNTHGARKPFSIRHRCGLRASSNNSHHTLVHQVNGSNSWHPPFTCLDENIKNMEVWSIFQMLETNTVENTNQHWSPGHSRSFGDSLLNQLTVVHFFPSGVLCLLCILPLFFVD